MKKSTYLKRLKTLDRKWLDFEIPQSTYESKRKKLQKQWLKSQKKKKKR